MIKKTTTFLLAISLATFFGCGGNISDSSTSGDPTQTTAPEDTLPELLEGAPRLTIPHTVSSEESVIVSMTVEQFDEIGAYDLKLLYDPDIMTATDVSVGPSVAYWAFVPNMLTPGEIKIAWLFFQTGSRGFSLSDGSVFLNITFEKVAAGISDITWDHSSSHEYLNEPYDWAFDEMNDEPHEHFYIDGSLEFE